MQSSLLNVTSRWRHCSAARPAPRTDLLFCSTHPSGDLHERGSGASVSACQGSSSRAVNTQVRRWEEDAEYELESEMSEVESSEEKRLAFACLSGAIEEVRAATSAP